MKKRIHQLSALLLAAVLAFGTLPTTVFATIGDPVGTDYRGVIKEGDSFKPGEKISIYLVGDEGGITEDDTGLAFSLKGAPGKQVKDAGDVDYWTDGLENVVADDGTTVVGKVTTFYRHEGINVFVTLGLDPVTSENGYYKIYTPIGTNHWIQDQDLYKVVTTKPPESTDDYTNGNFMYPIKVKPEDAREYNYDITLPAATGEYDGVTEWIVTETNTIGYSDDITYNKNGILFSAKTDDYDPASPKENPPAGYEWYDPAKSEYTLTTKEEFLFFLDKCAESALIYGSPFAGKTVKLGANIDLAGATLPQTFFGSLTPDAAVFDGQGYSISGLDSNSSLFNEAENAIIKNFTISGTITLKEEAESLGVIGHATNCTIANIGSNVAITAKGDDPIAGGIVGEASGSSILNCYAIGTISADTNNATWGTVHAGGIVGKTDGAIVNCYVSDGPITTNKTGNVGRIAGNAVAEETKFTYSNISDSSVTQDGETFTDAAALLTNLNDEDKGMKEIKDNHAGVTALKWIIAADTTYPIHEKPVPSVPLVDYDGTEATAPSATASKTDTTITLAKQTIAGETVEYGISESAIGTIKWQPGEEFTGLTADTDYYFFARVMKNTTHKAGATSPATKIKTDMSAAQKVAAAKTAIEAALASFTATNTTTAEIVMALANKAMTDAEITDVSLAWDSSDAFEKKDATDSAVGEITGTIKLTCGAANGTVALNRPIAQLPVDPAAKIATVKAAMEAALSTFVVANDTPTSEIEALLRDTLSKSGVTGVDASTWATELAKIAATDSADGSIKGTLTLTSGTATDTATDTVVVNLTVPRTATQKLAGTIATATAAKLNVVINEGAPSTVASDTKFVKQAVMDALNTAIAAAQTVAEDATDETKTTATTALESALAVFTSNIKTGTLSSGGGGGGGGGGGTTTPPAGGIIIDGKTEDIGKSETANGKTTVTLDEKKLSEKVDTAKDGSTVTIPVSTNTNSAAAQLSLKNVEEMSAKDITLTVQSGNTTYNLPTNAVSFDTVLTTLGATDSSKVNFTITMTQEKNLKLEDATLVGTPVSFEVTASYNGKTTSITNFDSVVPRSIKINKSQFDSITTAVVIENGKVVRHVPTFVYEENGEYFAIINSTTNSTYALITNKSAFTDVSGKWYADAATELSAREITKDIWTDTFDGDKAITRAEFAALLVNAFGLPRSEKASYSDVPADAWYSTFVATASQYGIVNGMGNNLFAPNATITREQAMVMLARAATAVKYAGGNKAIDSFPDYAKTATWAKNGVDFSLKSGLIVGRTNGTLDLAGNITRGETATVIIRLLQNAELVDVRSKV